MPYLNFGLGVQMEFRRQNYQREHGHGRESHCVTTSIQKLEMTEGTPKKKKKSREFANDETQFCCQICAQDSYRFQCSG